MKKLITLLIVLASLVSAETATVKKDNTAIYSSSSAKSSKIFAVDKYQELSVVKVKGDFTKISVNGKTGWVETASLKNESKVGGAKFVMGEKKVQNDGQELEDTYIIEDKSYISSKLNLGRSFVDEMNSPLDKEKLERKYTDYIKY